MYKSQNNLLLETTGKFYIPAEMVHSYETRSAVSRNVFSLPRYELSFTQKSMAFSGAKIWNEIPVNIKNAPSIDSFKEKLQSILLAYSERNLNYLHCQSIGVFLQKRRELHNIICFEFIFFNLVFMTVAFRIIF